MYMYTYKVSVTAGDFGSVNDAYFARAAKKGKKGETPFAAGAEKTEMSKEKKDGQQKHNIMFKQQTRQQIRQPNRTT